MSDFAPPSGPPPPKAPEVPPGWVARWNDQYKEWFYVNLNTKQSQWDKPTEPADGGSGSGELPPAYEPGSGPAPSDMKKSRGSPGPGDTSDDAQLAARLQAEEDARASSSNMPPRSPNSQSSGNFPSELPPRDRGTGERGFLGKLFGKGKSSSNNSYGQQQYNNYPQPQQYGSGYPQQQYGGYPQQQYGGYPQQQYGGYPQQQYGGGYGGGYGAPPPGAYGGGYGVGGGGGGGGLFGGRQSGGGRMGGGGMGALGGGALGLGAGLVGGMLLEDAIDDHSDQQAYQQGYDNGQDSNYDDGGGGDGGGFDDGGGGDF